jgi:branched-chain amino acid aminotransferase
MDGSFVAWEDARVHVLTHTLHYGSGVFEGIRCYKTKRGPAIFRLKEHLERFFHSADALGMQVPFSMEEIDQAVKETLRRNELEEAYIRPICFYEAKLGVSPIDLQTRVAIIACPFAAYLGEKPIRVKVSSFIRPHPRSVRMEAKVCGHYANSIYATMEAKQAGFDEALLLDYEGYVAEGAAENFFMVKGERLLTPAPGCILPGITRDTLIKLARNQGIEVEERKLTIDEVKRADEAFFCGTATEVAPIAQIDEVVIGNGKIGPITKRLRDLYLRVVRGEEKRYEDWLSYLYPERGPTQD